MKSLIQALLLASQVALAQDAISLEIVRKGQEGTSNPALILIPNVGISDMYVRIDCGGAWVEHKGGSEAGERIRLEFQPRVGTHQCSGNLRATFDDGSSGEMPLGFQVEMLPPLGITVAKDKLDTQGRTMEVALDRPAGKVEVTVYGIGGAELGSGTTPADGTPAGTPILAEWSASPGEVITMEVTAYDADGFWSKLELSPWYYEIPHEDVIFETGRADVRPTEEPKLKDAMKEVNDVLAKYGAEAKIQLYVGGYTDSVGDKTMNLALSNQRATAIAIWFKDAGFPGTIYAQGFGERGQAVRTPDEVDEARNRRAVYILAAEAPPVTAEVPGTSWKKVR